MEYPYHPRGCVVRDYIGDALVLLDRTIALRVDRECSAQGIKKSQALFLIARIAKVQVCG